jgi:tellurite resistance protein
MFPQPCRFPATKVNSQTNVEIAAMIEAKRSLTPLVIPLPVRIPPNFFGISFGLLGLANAWRLAAIHDGVPAFAGFALLALGTLVFAFLLAALAVKIATALSRVVAEMKDDVLGPFYALPPCCAIVLAIGLRSFSPGPGRTVLTAALVLGTLYGAWVTTYWMMRDTRDEALANPAYFLSTVAFGFLAADALALYGLRDLAWMYFGVGTISWLMLGSITGYRLNFVSPRLQPALIPSLAIEVSWAPIAANAYLSLDGNRPDAIVMMLAGYAVYMVLRQIVLLHLYRRLRFGPPSWMFTFPSAAVAVFAERWNAASPSALSTVAAIVALAAATAIVGWVGVRTLVAISRGEFLGPPALETHPRAPAS